MSPADTTTPLAEVLRALIRAGGPISVARFMALSAGHPEHGYYMRRRDPFGAAGDFTTAPEIGQVFGELLGLCCAQHWLDSGRPGRLLLVELGPGRGTMLADALRAAASVPGCREALEVHLVETSPALRTEQRRRLGDAARWHESFDEVPPGGPLIVVANELFDALPVHQLVKREDGAWVERLIALDEHGQPGFVLDSNPSPLARHLPPGCEAAEPGAVTELGPAREALAAAIGGRVASDGGFVLVVDFGDSFVGPTGDTLQAVRAHHPHPVLEAPGEADLTAHVDFRALAEAASRAGAAIHGPVSQGRFLQSLGIEARTAALLRRATPEQAKQLESARHRLTDPGEMGELFKVLAVVPPGAPPPPGFPLTAPPA